MLTNYIKHFGRIIIKL